ncbi:DUF493 family protein [Chitinophaga sp. Cy-1792]|uniref:HP0495 family protein n=1 Tax=Chitinophaga sp. Cy-1792 TaxID=2608339 RepID=UPI0014228830|nr:DUF493 family protein [Chitinophaga sp. Cy-1792]NIG55978.1 DUF493 domain-containing protein [Chitinophaga sp. Cy-1792]
MTIDENLNANLNEDPYQNLRSLLQQSLTFPTTYVFKFIVKAEEDKEAALKAVFAHKKNTITTTDSSGGKYKSFTVNAHVQNEEEIIEYYKEVSKIESVIML